MKVKPTLEEVKKIAAQEKISSVESRIEQLKDL